jgi:rhodanese-related sulfurtransferase
MATNDAAQHYRNKLAYEIDAWDLNELLRAGENVVVVDARSESAYANEHIRGAVNLPHRRMDHASTRDLDHNALYVTYCDGIGCNASTKGALKMVELGFQVKELIGGIEWWKRDGYPVDSTLVAIER